MTPVVTENNKLEELKKCEQDIDILHKKFFQEVEKSHKDKGGSAARQRQRKRSMEMRKLLKKYKSLNMEYDKSTK